MPCAFLEADGQREVDAILASVAEHWHELWDNWQEVCRGVWGGCACLFDY